MFVRGFRDAFVDAFLDSCRLLVVRLGARYFRVRGGYVHNCERRSQFCRAWQKKIKKKIISKSNNCFCHLPCVLKVRFRGTVLSLKKKIFELWILFRSGSVLWCSGIAEWYDVTISWFFSTRAAERSWWFMPSSDGPPAPVSVPSKIVFHRCRGAAWLGLKLAKPPSSFTPDFRNTLHTTTNLTGTLKLVR